MEYTDRKELLYKEGVRLLKEHGKASCVLFQRKLAIGYGAAREIVDRMLKEGIAIPGKGYTIILNTEGGKK
jgi:DNA segregation ATPase FtsK/SpoIIIE-like protein